MARRRSRRVRDPREWTLKEVPFGDQNTPINTDCPTLWLPPVDLRKRLHRLPKPWHPLAGNGDEDQKEKEKKINVSHHPETQPLNSIHYPEQCEDVLSLLKKSTERPFRATTAPIVVTAQRTQLHEKNPNYNPSLKRVQPRDTSPWITYNKESSINPDDSYIQIYYAGEVLLKAFAHHDIRLPKWSKSKKRKNISGTTTYNGTSLYMPRVTRRAAAAAAKKAATETSSSLSENRTDENSGYTLEVSKKKTMMKGGKGQLLASKTRSVLGDHTNKMISNHGDSSSSPSVSPLSTASSSNLSRKRSHNEMRDTTSSTTEPTATSLVTNNETSKVQQSKKMKTRNKNVFSKTTHNTSTMSIKGVHLKGIGLRLQRKYEEQKECIEDIFEENMKWLELEFTRKRKALQDILLETPPSTSAFTSKRPKSNREVDCDSSSSLRNTSSPHQTSKSEKSSVQKDENLPKNESMMECADEKCVDGKKDGNQ
eukprot:g2186.t1